MTLHLMTLHQSTVMNDDKTLTTLSLTALSRGISVMDQDETRALLNYSYS